jgi:hypothetical protein
MARRFGEAGWWLGRFFPDPRGRRYNRLALTRITPGGPPELAAGGNRA